MSDLIDKIENGYNIHDLDPIKFHLRNIQVEDRSIDNTINMGSFSRLREIQQTSNTVNKLYLFPYIFFNLIFC